MRVDLSDIRESLKINRLRCPYCHDDIRHGGDNRACRECLTWHHTGCWTEHGACVSCGARSEARKGSQICVVHTPDLISESAKQDLRDLWGGDHCTCEPRAKNSEFLKLIDTVNRLTKPYGVRPFGVGPYGTVQVVGDHDTANIGVEAQIKEFNDLVRGEKGPKEEPPCKHKFHPRDNRCVYCHEDMMEVARKGFGSVCLEELAQATEQCGAAAVMDSFGVTCGESRGADRHPWGWKDYTFWAVMILPPLVVALVKILSGYMNP